MLAKDTTRISRSEMEKYISSRHFSKRTFSAYYTKKSTSGIEKPSVLYQHAVESLLCWEEGGILCILKN